VPRAYRSGRPVIKIGPNGALGSHEIRPIHSVPSLRQSIPSHTHTHLFELGEGKLSNSRTHIVAFECSTSLFLILSQYKSEKEREEKISSCGRSYGSSTIVGRKMVKTCRNLLLSLRPTGSQGASPKVHLSCLWRYLLSLSAISSCASETSILRPSTAGGADLIVVAAFVCVSAPKTAVQNRNSPNIVIPSEVL